MRVSGGGPAGGSPVVITGGAGFRATIHTNPHGEFTLTLPYGRYEFSGVPVNVAPLVTTRVELVAKDSGSSATGPEAGLWRDPTHARLYPEPFSLQGVLQSREPASVAEPPDFTGLRENRLGLESQRGFSWTATQYKLHGIDATDSYQPGRAAIHPNIEALDEVTVRSSFAATTSNAYGTEVGLFLREPGAAWHGAAWHGAVSSADTGAVLASSNLPAPAGRGLVQQPDRFAWYTRDSVEVGGPVTRWSDIFASAAGQWSSQTVPLAARGNEQRSRLLFGNVRGRVQAGERDQFEGEFVGSRIDLSDWGIPVGLEALEGNRMMPSFVLPGGFGGEGEEDHLDFVQAGWTRVLPHGSGAGALQVRYGYSAAHLDTFQTGHGADPAQSRIELLGGAVTGAPPLTNMAVRLRHSLEGTWQPAPLRTASIRHHLAAGAGWKSSSPRNRFAVPSGMNLITAQGTPAFVVDFDPLPSSRSTVRSFTAYVANRVKVTSALALDLGALADISRGSVKGQPETLIRWTSLSPRAGFALLVPHSRGLILRGAYSRLYSPLAGRYLDFGNPSALGGSEYQWIDRNADGWFQPGERDAMVMRFGGPYSSIAHSLRRPFADEFNVRAELSLTRTTYARLHLFRRDEKDRIAAADVGVPAQAFSASQILDHGPDALPGTFDDQGLTVYQQDPATFGQDRYVLTNPRGLRMMNAGFLAEIGTELRGLMMHASFVAEKAYGPANPGDAVFENDPGVIGALFLDPNTEIHAAGRSFMDRAYVGKVQATYALPWSGIELASVANYMDGLAFARQLLVEGLAQGPIVVATTVRGSPEGGNRTSYAVNWNLRARREFQVRAAKLAAWADVLNVTNAGQKIQESDVHGAAFNLRLPVAIQASRAVRLGFRLDF